MQRIINDLIDWDNLEWQPGHHYLYGIYDEPDTFVYIGITNNPKVRYNGHQHTYSGSRCVRGICGCSQHTYGLSARPFEDWWQNVRSTGNRPRMCVFADLGTDIAIAQECERVVIHHLLQSGNTLFNRHTWKPKGDLSAA